MLVHVAIYQGLIGVPILNPQLYVFVLKMKLTLSSGGGGDFYVAQRRAEFM